MREDLARAVEQARADSNPSPSNEQETCFRIIDPLLHAMGYGRMDISIQERDRARERPDYTLLPGTPSHTWFIEAKAWDVGLNHDHANQAVNYANTQGKRWVVLTNGRDWRLYDNQLFGTVEAKLACYADLEDEACVAFLEALSKPSILQGKLEAFVSNERLYTCLSGQITRPDSEVVRAIHRVLRGTPGLAAVRQQDIVGYFENRSAVASSQPASGELCPSDTLNQSPNQPAGEVAPTPPPGNALPLGSLTAGQVTGAHPSQLVFPDGRSVPLSKWNQLTVHVAHFALQQGTLRPPVYLRRTTLMPLIARHGSVEALRIRAHAALPAPFSDLVVDVHKSAAEHVRCCCSLLRQAGVDPVTLHLALA